MIADNFFKFVNNHKSIFCLNKHCRREITHIRRSLYILGIPEDKHRNIAEPFAEN